MFIKSPFLIALIIFNVLSMTVMAGTPQNKTVGLDKTWISTLSVGTIWTKSGENQTFYITPDIERTYTAPTYHHALPLGSFFLGLQKPLFSESLAQLGLVVAASTQATMKGHIWDDANAAFDNFIYQYHIQSSRVAVQGKLLINKTHRLIPWISGSIGVSVNHAYGFTNTPIIIEALPSNNFSSHTTAALTYGLGAGVQRALNQHWQVGVGYEFIDWGRSQLGRAKCQTLNSGLQLNHRYTNGLLFDVTYIA